MRINLTQATLAFADALDLAGVERSRQHSRRVAYIALECATRLGWSGGMLQSTLHAALLHDCGLSANHRQTGAAPSPQWCGDDDLHCLRGYGLLSQFPPFAHFADAVLYHHSPWCDVKHLLGTETAAQLSNLLLLANSVEHALSDVLHFSPLQARCGIRAQVAEEAGMRFSPELAAVFLEVAKPEAFWLRMSPRYLNRHLQQLSAEWQRELDTCALRNLSTLFSDIIDAVSPFTLEHSTGVALVAAELGQRCGLTEETCLHLEIAGHLHDLGKLGVPKAILDKPAPLSDDERLVMTHHSFDTFQILDTVDGLAHINRWASLHHERPAGDGYPFHESGKTLSLECRIVAVADVLQALVQDRPYRSAMTPPEIHLTLKQDAQAGHLDDELVDLVCADLDNFIVKALTTDVPETNAHAPPTQTSARPPRTMAAPSPMPPMAPMAPTRRRVLRHQPRGISHV